MGPKGWSCSTRKLAALDQLEHGQERDRHHDPVAEILEQVLQHHHGRVEQGGSG